MVDAPKGFGILLTLLALILTTAWADLPGTVADLRGSLRVEETTPKLRPVRKLRRFRHLEIGDWAIQRWWGDGVITGFFRGDLVELTKYRSGRPPSSKVFRATSIDESFKPQEEFVGEKGCRVGEEFEFLGGDGKTGRILGLYQVRDQDFHWDRLMTVEILSGESQGSIEVFYLNHSSLPFRVQSSVYIVPKWLCEHNLASAHRQALANSIRALRQGLAGFVRNPLESLANVIEPD